IRLFHNTERADVLSRMTSAGGHSLTANSTCRVAGPGPACAITPLLPDNLKHRFHTTATKHHEEPEPESRGHPTGAQADACGPIRSHVHRAPAIFDGEPVRRVARIFSQARWRNGPHVR